MRIEKRDKLTISTLLLLCVIFLCGTALAATVASPNATAEGVRIVEVATEIDDNFVRYPQLEGLQNPTIQQTINNAIVSEANITQRLITLSTLQAGGTGLQVSYTAFFQDSLFSVVINAKGMMENLRNGHQYTALSYDLLTGARLLMSGFFSDPSAAISWMEEQLLDGFSDELSNYLEHAEVTPLPAESFSFDQNGITFYYPFQQFSLLNGYSGAVQFQYGELQAFLIPADGSVPSRVGAVLPQLTDEEIQERILSAVTQGTLPYVSVVLGDAIPDLIAEYRLSRTPDQYPGGRYFQFEAPAFRQVLILSDALTSGYDASVVEGILATRMNLFGIQTGVTLRTRWHAILGEPSASVALDAAIAADYGLPVGTADYYTMANRQLMLYADENEVLYAVRLSK